MQIPQGLCLIGGFDGNVALKCAGWSGFLLSACSFDMCYVHMYVNMYICVYMYELQLVHLYVHACIYTCIFEIKRILYIHKSISVLFEQSFWGLSR